MLWVQLQRFMYMFTHKESLQHVWKSSFQLTFFIFLKLFNSLSFL